MFNRRDFVNSDKFSGRDHDVLTQSPHLFKRSNNQRDSLSTQLNQLMPVTKVSGLSDEERLDNRRIQTLLRPQGDEEVHHQNGLGLIGTVLDNADDAGKDYIYRLLEHNDIPIGDNILNLINLDRAGHDELHAFAQEQGLEIMRNGTVGLAKKLSESKNIEETLEYLQDYIDYGVPLLREKQDEIIAAREMSKGKRFADAKVLDEYQKLKPSALQQVDAKRDAQAAGAVVGEKPTVINAGEGSRVYVEAGNGNGNGNKAQKIKDALRNGNGKY